jgi:hypothetical protein
MITPVADAAAGVAASKRATDATRTTFGQRAVPIGAGTPERNRRIQTSAAVVFGNHCRLAESLNSALF